MGWGSGTSSRSVGGIDKETKFKSLVKRNEFHLGEGVENKGGALDYKENAEDYYISSIIITFPQIL